MFILSNKYYVLVAATILYLICVLYAYMSSYIEPNSPNNTVARDFTVCKWLPTPGLDGERSAPAVVTNIATIMSAATI